MPPGVHLYLLRLCSSPEVVDAIDFLATEARAAPMLGLIYIAMYGQREYAIGIKGMARTSATYARGALRTVDDELAAIVKRRRT